jgi:N-acetylneuraminate synthase
LLESAIAKTLIVAEVGQAHDGSLGTAHAFIDAIADAGAQAVKFQTHLAAAESTPGEPWRVAFSRQDTTRYDYWRRMEFSEEGWAGLAVHARERGLAFVSSPFSLEAVELLLRTGIDVWKVASGEVGNSALLEALAATGLPVMVSSGMSTLGELDAAVEVLRAGGGPWAVMQCTTSYPCPPEQIGINVLGQLRDRYGRSAGLSDHSGTIFPSLIAASMGACAVEVHVTLSRHAFGPDVSSSLTLDELAELVRGVRFVETMLASPVDKDAMADSLEPVRRLFTKSVVTRVALAAGTVLGAEHLIAKKPGTGIPAADLPSLVARRLRRDVEVDHLLSEDDLEPAP